MANIRKKKTIIKWVTFTVAIIIVAIELFPIFIIMSNGFKRDLDIRNSNPFSFKPTLYSYKKVFQKSDFLPSIKNSLIVGISSTAISLLVGSMASYGISRFRFKGRKVLSYSFLVSRMIPQIALAVPLFMVFDSLSMTDSYISLILAHTSFNIPYVIWLLLPFFSSISISFEEAARVDGCNRKQIFWKIFLPLTAPGLPCANRQYDKNCSNFREWFHGTICSKMGATCCCRNHNTHSGDYIYTHPSEIYYRWINRWWRKRVNTIGNAIYNIKVSRKR